MILSPAQIKTLQDTYALGVFLEADPLTNEMAVKLREAASELLDLSDKLSDRQELTAPF